MVDVDFFLIFVERKKTMKYTTYISAADKLSGLGQKDLAKRFISHANEIVNKRVSEFDFDILVGVKPFFGAKFVETRVLREKESNTIMFIFKSGPNSQNTHRINATLRHNGDVVWHDGNLFHNRKSVRNFERLLGIVVEYNKDVQKLFSELSLKNEKMNLVHRTFYQ